MIYISAMIYKPFFVARHVCSRGKAIQYGNAAFFIIFKINNKGCLLCGLTEEMTIFLFSF